MAWNTTDLVILMESIPEILAPVPDIVLVMVEIVSYMAVGGLIVGILGAVIISLNKGMSFKLK